MVAHNAALKAEWVAERHPDAIVLGAEGKGVHELVRKKCDFLISIPMLGKVPSLNVSVAAGIMLYEIVRQRRQKTITDSK